MTVAADAIAKTCSAVTLHFLFLVEAHSLQLQPVPESTLCAFLSYFFLVDHPLRSFAFAVSRFLCLSPSPARHRCLHQVRYCSLSLAQALARSGSQFLTRFSVLTRFSFAVSHSLSLAVSHSLSLAVSHSLSLVVCHSLSLAVCHSLSLAVCHSLSLQLCVRLSLSLSLSLSNISIQDIPCGSKYDVNLPLIIASTTTECLCSWAKDLRRDPERVFRFFLASHVPKKSYLQIISIVK